MTQANTLSFTQYQLAISNNSLKDYFKNSKFSPIKRKELNLWEKLQVDNNSLKVHTYIDSYLCADLAEFIRQNLIENGISFTYETVMSHEGKVNFMKSALKKGYRVYLYFIATEDPEININRVNIRVAQNGHFVLPDVIKKRYFKSLGLLKAAVNHTNRAYIFDNSGEQALLVAEINDGAEIRWNEIVEVPNWVSHYLL